MSEWTVQLEFEEGTSSKFWRARIEGKTLYVNYGKIGTTGQTQVKDFADAAAATKEYDKLIREKQKKGYVAAGDAGARGRGDDDGDAADEDDDDAPAAKSPPPAKPPPAAAAKPAAPAARPGGGLRLVLDAGSRKVETLLSLDGTTLRMDALETYATPDAAKRAYERLRKLLAAEGYRDEGHRGDP